MGLDNFGKKVKHSLQALTVMGGVLAGTPAESQESRQPPIAAESPLFTVDDFIAPNEGTPEERRGLAEDLFNRMSVVGDEHKDGSREKVFPLSLGTGPVSIRVITFPEARIMRVLVFKGDRAPIFLEDNGITGTPSANQMPVEEKEIPRPQTFTSWAEHPLANRLYLGLLRQLLSAF